MKRRIFLVLIMILCPCVLWAQEAAGRAPVLSPPQKEVAGHTSVLPSFTKDDRVLILAPHPDDEAIATAGVIMRCVQVGAKVKVVCVTNGDHNEIAFILYEKRLTLRRNEFLHMGEVRRKETLTALSGLGVTPSDVAFLGYPDFGTLSIMLKYWGSGTRPYHSIMTRINSVAYSDALSPGAPYIGESILRDMRRVLAEFKPTKVFVSHPADTNMDHQAVYLFFKVALWDMTGMINPEVYPYLIHVVGWPASRGLHPERALIPPSENIFDISWKKLELTPEEVARKQKMIGCYKSQLTYVPSYLYTFARKNELFGDCPEVVLKKSTGDLYLWHNISQNDEDPADAGKDTVVNQVSNLAFASKDGFFFVKIVLKTALTKNLGVRFLILPYSQETDFSVMPKFSISIGIGGMQIREKQRVVKIKNSLYTAKDKIIIVKLPFASLGSPDRILCKTWARFSSEFPFRAPAWRVITVDAHE